MSTVLVVVIVVVVVALVAGAGFLVWSQARTQRLRRQFGPEYDRTVDSHANRREAERELHEREQRHQELDIRPLEPRARELYQEQWTHIQEHFVDAPEAAVEQADRLVTTVMGERGYPVQDFDDRVAILSVEHGRMLDHYRRGHEISTRAGREESSTEDLRQAMVHYRALFEDLLSAAGPATSADDRPNAHAQGPDEGPHSRTETEQAQREQLRREHDHREQVRPDGDQERQARSEDGTSGSPEQDSSEQDSPEQDSPERDRREQASRAEANRDSRS